MGQRVASGVRTPLGGVAAMLGVGALGVLSPAVAEAGWWSLVGLALAALVATLTAVSLADLVANSGPASVYRHVRGRLGVIPGRLAGVLGLAGRLVAIAAVADLVGTQLGARGSVGILIVFAVCGYHAMRPRGGRQVFVIHRILAVVVLITLALVVAVGLVIAPVESVTFTRSGVAGVSDPTGILAAAGLLFFGFVGFDRIADGGSRVGALAVVSAAAGMLLTAYVALRQLGGPRLAISDTPLPDTLNAADGASLGLLLAVGLLAGAVLALDVLVGGSVELVADLAAARELPSDGGPFAAVAVGAVAGAVALFTAPATTVAVAACLMLGSYAFVNSAARSLCRAQRSTWVRTGCCGLALSVIVAVNISVLSLIITVAVLLAGTLLCTLSTRSADAE